MGKQKLKMGICSYCGTFAVVTADHVIPKALFNTAYPMPSHPRPPKVSACPECNNSLKSDDDAFLRDLLAADIASHQHPVAQVNWVTVRKATRQNESEFARYVSSDTHRLISVVSKGGIFLSPGYEVRLPLDRVIHVLSNVTRGLCLFYTNYRLPDDTKFTVRRWYDGSELDDILILFNVLGAPQVGIGDGSVFSCRYFVQPQNPSMSYWILRFYESVYFTIWTNFDPSSLEMLAP